MSRDSKRLLLIFLLAAAIMLLEVALTRVFSFITYHHMTYLVIGVAMLGFGAAGTFLTVRPQSAAGASAEARVARHATLFAVSSVLAVFLLPKVPFHSMNMYWLGDYWNVVALLALTVLVVVPFFFGGICVAALISDAGEFVNRVYFADLAGSAAGSLLAIALVNGVGAVATCVIAAATSLLAAALAAERSRPVYFLATAAFAVLAPLSENPAVLPLHVPPGKQMYGAEDSIETTQWHAITRLDVSNPMECNCSFGGALSQQYTGSPPIVRLIFQDGSNLTGIIHPTPTPRQTPVLGYFIQGAAYTIRPGASGLVIGSGGGVDVMVALHHGAKHMVAVDVNPKTMRLVRGLYADFAGHVFDGPDVEPVVSEGRHFLSRDHRQFDVIQLSGVDTWAAQAAGAYALTESFIYTAEAFDQYLAHLRPDGILGLSRPYVQPPLETFRLVATAADALERAGVSDPSRHLYVLAGLGQTSDAPWAELLVKRSAFTEEETSTLGAWTKHLGFDVVYDPFRTEGGPLDSLARSSRAERKLIISSYPLEIHPVPDDAPFYFQNHRWRDLFRKPELGLAPPAAMWILAGSFLEMLVLSAGLILYPLYRKRSGAAGRGGRAGTFFYFASLGMGFILVEIALLQKLMVFLGGPAYALSITLSALLLSSGLGSLASQRMAKRPFELLRWVVPALAASVLAQAFFVDMVTHHLMGLSLFARAVVAVAAIFPMGLLMGMPFPAGLRYLETHRPGLKPWAWGINACATVVGSTASMVIVSSFGFQMAIFCGAAIYLIGWAVFALSRGGEATPVTIARGSAGAPSPAGQPPRHILE